MSTNTLLTFQQLYKELTGEISSLPDPMAARLINRAWKRVNDYRMWSWQIVSNAQIFVPAVVTAGSATVTFNKTAVVMDAPATTALNAIAFGNPPLASPTLGVGYQIRLGTSAQGLSAPIGPNYTITVQVEDKGTPSMSSVANATVYVRDVNDNAPEWQIPRQLYKNNHPVIPVLNISETYEKRALIIKLNAYDRDDDDAGRVSYRLHNHHDGMFAINETTGELITVTSPLRNGHYKLQIRAIDHGNPPKQTEIIFVINVLDNGRLTSINLIIIIGMVGITVLISIFLIVAIICVRRRPKFQKYLPTFETPNDNSNQYFNHNHCIYQTDDNPIPPFSDNESFVFLPQAYYGNNHPESMTMQQMNSSRPPSRMEYPLTLPSSNNFNTIDNTNGVQISQNIEVCFVDF